MVNRNDFVKVRCGECGRYFKEQVGRLREVATFQHGCGAFVRCNLNELDAFVREQANDDTAYLTLHAVS